MSREGRHSTPFKTKTFYQPVTGIWKECSLAQKLMELDRKIQSVAHSMNASLPKGGKCLPLPCTAYALAIKIQKGAGWTFLPPG